MSDAPRHLLVPVDFSANSKMAFKLACTLSGRAGAQITLLHVVEPPYNFATAVKGMIEMMEENAIKRMKTLIEESGAESDIDFEVRHGRTSQEILKCTDREDIDMVVMGSRGQSGLSKLVLGSVSESIAHDLPVPLLLVPEGDEDQEVSIRSIAFTTDFRRNDPVHFLYAKSISDLLNANISILHVTPVLDFESDIKLRGFTELMREMAKDPELTIEMIEKTHLLQGIASYVAKNDVSALVFNRYKKSVIQSLFGKDHTDEMMVYADIPLLIIPSGFVE